MPFEIAPVVYDGNVAAICRGLCISPHNLSAEMRTQDGVGSSLREKTVPLLATVLHVA